MLRMSHFQFTGKTVQQNIEQREERGSLQQSFFGKWKPVGNDCDRFSSNYDLHFTFLLKDSCIHSPSNLSSFSNLQEHL